MQAAFTRNEKSVWECSSVVLLLGVGNVHPSRVQRFRSLHSAQQHNSATLLSEVPKCGLDGQQKLRWQEGGLGNQLESGIPRYAKDAPAGSEDRLGKWVRTSRGLAGNKDGGTSVCQHLPCAQRNSVRMLFWPLWETSSVCLAWPTELQVGYPSSEKRGTTVFQLWICLYIIRYFENAMQVKRRH